MEGKLYKIKPFKFVKNFGKYSATVPFGTYYVYKYDKKWYWEY